MPGLLSKITAQRLAMNQPPGRSILPSICPECAHEWLVHAVASSSPDDEKVYRDSAGNVLKDGDAVTVIKDLKLKGSAGVIKMGTRVRNIRLVDSDHDIDCKIDGFGAMSLKTEFVRKV